jgi:tRNA 2-thiouridine synthesizing protein A
MDEILLDVRGLSCPLPVLKARKRLRELTAGSRLRVLATDPKAPGDFVELCGATGDRLVASAAADGVYTFLIERR